MPVRTFVTDVRATRSDRDQLSARSSQRHACFEIEALTEREIRARLKVPIVREVPVVGRLRAVTRQRPRALRAAAGERSDRSAARWRWSPSAGAEWTIGAMNPRVGARLHAHGTAQTKDDPAAGRSRSHLPALHLMSGTDQ